MAYSDAGGVYLRPLFGVARALYAPARLITTSLTWFKDGSQLPASGVPSHSRKNQVWRIFLNAAPPLLVANDAKDGTPSPDGRRIGFTNTAGTEILVANSDGSGAMRVLSAAGYDTFPFLLWSPEGDLQAPVLWRGQPDTYIADINPEQHALTVFVD